MGNPKKDSKHFQPEHLGKLSKEFDGNKGRKYQVKGGHEKPTIWAQPKGH
ncbi:small acid-soluble spore protein N (minor) [Salirhabdus euzebyi]|uniref:Small acid-soluble spore protein N (Minor) n=1 Tax=Salirhabdus euzebyi TaxID=394506 RepID=A0A841PYM8_9BACI|nr:small acid-soluble spore protein N [Salirhabdus euzebyi]MBB6452806.1 small acid-soluble spore protein N (minor) [Salirhabdus euzebyi]